MLYKTTRIYEDNEILNGQNMAELSRHCNVSESYLSLLKDKKRIASEKVYLEIRKAIYELSRTPEKIK